MNLLRHPLGLASMASLPLLLFATAFVLLAGVLLFAFRDINAMLEQAAEQKIPVLTQTTALVRECEWLRGMMFRLMQTDSELVREAIIITLKERIDEAGEMASRLEAIGLYKDKVESLKEQLSSLDGIADDVNTLITRTHRTGRFRGRAAGSVEARSLQNPLTTSRIEHGPRCALRPTCDLRDVRMGTQRQGRSVACPVHSAYLGDGGSSQSPV